jgi:NAD(P)-dependent dehydrogenase (short-subunit alcohol dehydrogenase family)
MDGTGAAAKVALVTGGAQGIGKGIVRHLLDQGWRVALADLDAAAGRETVGEYAELGELLFLPVDVSAEDSVRVGLARVESAWGRLDGLVNNAGLAAPGAVPVTDLPLERWLRTLAVNLTGAFLTCKYAIPLLRASRGAIVNIASTRALQSEPNSEAYAASKGGLVALTHALAVSLGPDIRVNCVSPGWIAVDPCHKAAHRQSPALTPEDHAQHPVGRAGEPRDVSALVAFLLSAEAGFITGQNLVVDGGMTRKMIYRD